VLALFFVSDFMNTKLFSELGLSPELLKAIDQLGFEKASPIQAEAIPVLMEGKDVIGQSQTGSGKTAAFAIPAIEKVDPHQRSVQILVLCPTRELAVQVSEDVHKLALFKRGVRALPIYGGQSYERQFHGLKQGAQIVIGTPGRLMDHMRRGTLRLDQVRMVVLDEADVMLDMGFREDIEFILEAAPDGRQTVFFSATIPRAIQELIQKHAREPVPVRIEQKAKTVPTVEQVYYEVDRRFKLDLLTRLIDLHDLKLGIVFCNTKRMVDELVDHLNAQGYSADRLHGDMSQALRDRVMNKFRKSSLEFLVATDVAARGIDVEDVQVVFNYDLPYDPEDYLHRIGRTSRFGRSGKAVSFAAGREVFQIRQIERFTRVKIQRAKVPTLSEVEEARALGLLGKVRATIQAGEFKRQEPLIELLLEEGFTSTDVAAALLHQLQGGDSSPSRRRSQEKPASEKRPGPHPAQPGERRPVPAAAFQRQDEPRSRPPGKERRQEQAARDFHRERSFRPLERAPSGARGEAHPKAPREGPSPERVRKQKAEMFGQQKNAPDKKAPKKPAPSESQTRLHLNIGQEMGVTPAEVVNAVMGETGLPARVIGTVDIRDRHLFMNVSDEHAKSIIAKLNRAQIRGRKIKAKVA
jgi:ATP-dependent RNA helicase DeaD